MEVAMGVAHPPGGLHHNNKIPPDYTRVEVHTVMPEFIQWKIDHVTPEGLELLGEVMNQFILWHKWDIILTARTPLVALQLHLEGVVEEGEIHDHHLPEMPRSSPPCTELVPEMPQSSPPRSKHVHEMPQSSSSRSEHVHEMPQSSPPRCEHVHDEVRQSSLQAEPTHAQQEAS